MRQVPARPSAADATYHELLMPVKGAVSQRPSVISDNLAPTASNMPTNVHTASGGGTLKTGRATPTP